MYIYMYIYYIYIYIYIYIYYVYIYIYIYVFVRNKCMNGDIDDILMVKSGVIVEMLWLNVDKNCGDCDQIWVVEAPTHSNIVETVK